MAGGTTQLERRRLDTPLDGPMILLVPKMFYHLCHHMGKGR